MNKFKVGDRIVDKLDIMSKYIITDVLPLRYKLTREDGLTFNFSHIYVDENHQLLTGSQIKTKTPKFKAGDIIINMFGYEYKVADFSKGIYTIYAKSGLGVNYAYIKQKDVELGYTLVPKNKLPNYSPLSHHNGASKPASMCYEGMDPEGKFKKTENKATTVEEERDQYLRSVLGDWLDLVNKGENK